MSRITANVATAPTASEMAQQMATMESNFSGFFRRATGNTFTHFVQQVRINRARQLLMQSDCFVSQKYYEVDFNNVANFNRRFLEIKGMTPSQSRQQAEERFGSAGSEARGRAAAAT